MIVGSYLDYRLSVPEIEQSLDVEGKKTLFKKMDKFTSLLRIEKHHTVCMQAACLQL